MSYTKEYAKAAQGYFKGAWYYKPWYVRKQDSLPEIAQPSGIMGPQGLEWPKYPGGYKPTFEDRAGIPGLYKPMGVPVGGHPAIKVSPASGRNVWRGSNFLIFAILAAANIFVLLWYRKSLRWAVHLRDEEAFHKFGCIAYMQARNDCKYYANAAKLDMYCREHMDQIPGVNRNFYHQENILQPALFECSTPARAKHQAYGNMVEHPPFWNHIVTA
ncbi:hypothetical protein DIPPA_32628 [Diplonema papillatum]|nr:hypothetical protein DIPPA_32628 [Diplonema papillatum]|eukprot:gene14538-22248_t